SPESSSLPAWETPPKRIDLYDTSNLPRFHPRSEPDRRQRPWDQGSVDTLCQLSARLCNRCYSDRVQNAVFALSSDVQVSLDFHVSFTNTVRFVEPQSRSSSRSYTSNQW